LTSLGESTNSITGTFVFQHIEKEGVEQRCSVAMNKTNEYKVNGLSKCITMIGISKVNVFWVACRDSLEKEQMIASNFYRFGYNIKACEKLSKQLNSTNALIKDGLSKSLRL